MNTTKIQDTMVEVDRLLQQLEGTEPDETFTLTDAPIRAQVGQRIRDHRESLGRSRREVAHALGITYQQLAHIEAGRTGVSLERLDRIARVLDSTMSTLLLGCGG